MKKPMKFRIPIPHRVPGLDIGSGTTDKADEEIAVPASATDLDSVTESVGDMLKGASNVINDFDEVWTPADCILVGVQRTQYSALKPHT